MNDSNIHELPKTDNELMSEGMFDISLACSRFIEMKNPMGKVFHHMADSILCYVEEYILKNQDTYGLKRIKIDAIQE